jgi:hypothetical protein
LQMTSRGSGLAGSGGGVEVVSRNDLETGSGDELLIDENDGAGSTSRVGNLCAGVCGDGFAGGYSSGGHHDERVRASRYVEVTGVDVEYETGYDRRNCGQLLACRDQVNVNCADAGGLVDEAKGYLAGRCGLALVLENELLQVGGGVSDQNGVLAGEAEGRLGRRENLFGSGGVGRDGIGARNDGNIGCDGAKTEVVGDGVAALIDIEAGSVGRGIDDADLRQGGVADDALAASENTEDGSNRGETYGLPDEIINRHTPWARWGHLMTGHRYVSL